MAADVCVDVVAVHYRYEHIDDLGGDGSSVACGEGVTVSNDEFPVGRRFPERIVHPSEHIRVVVPLNLLRERLRVYDDEVYRTIAEIFHKVVPKMRKNPLRVDLRQLDLIPLFSFPVAVIVISECDVPREAG